MIKSLLSKIEKKDLVYWIIILILSLVVVMAKLWGDDAKVIDKFGFAATLTSLILGFIAIIYSFIQGHDTNSINQNINKSIESLSSVAGKIDNSTKKLEEVENIASRFEESINKLDLLDSTLNQMKKEICGTTESSIRSLEDLLVLNNTKSEQPNITKKDKLEIANLIAKGSLKYSKQFLYVLLKKHEQNQICDIRECSGLSLLQETEFRKNLTLGANTAILQICLYSNLITAKGSKGIQTIIDIETYSDELKAAILPYREKMKEEFDFIDRHIAEEKSE